MNSPKRYEVIVVGAGAAGMTAAISAARQGARIALLEHMDAAGKKLLATGNGKCNFTNRVQGMEQYRGQDPAFVLPALRLFGFEQTLAFFRELGIFAVEKRGGYFYPASGQAVSVRQALLWELKRLGVDCFYGVGIRTIQKQNRWFAFDTKQGPFRSRCCIIATGGKAAKKTGSDGSGIPYLTAFGHRMVDLVPALVPLQGKQSFLKELAGVRADAVLSLFADGQMLFADRGEVQMTEACVSGIPAFQVSRYASYALKAQKSVWVTLDFAPDLSRDALKEYFQMQRSRFADCPLPAAWGGLLNQKLIPVLLKLAGLNEALSLKQVGMRDCERLIAQIKGLRVDLTGTKSFDYAQVSAGGVDTREVDPQTMESRLVSGLYLAGEVLDIDGMCGGYNLQWAWSSGWVAGFQSGSAKGKR